MIFIGWKTDKFSIFKICGVVESQCQVYRSALSMQYSAPNTPTSTECVLAMKRELEFVQAAGKEVLQDL